MKRYSLLPLVLALGLSSCTHYYYGPNSHNVPMLRGQHDARAMIGYISADEIEGIETQLAYSPVNHMGLTFNYASAHGGDGNNRGNGHQIEGAAGYYLPLSAKTTFEVYGGFGGGNIYNQYDSVEHYTSRFTRVFVQPAFGFTTDYFDAIFSVRFAYLANKLTDPGSALVSSHSEMIELLNTPNSFLMEPAITLRGGFKWLKVQTQFGASLNLTNTAFPQETSLFSIGLYSSFTPSWLAGRKARPVR